MASTTTDGVSAEVQETRQKILEQMQGISKALGAAAAPVYPHADGGGVTTWQHDHSPSRVEKWNANSPRFNPRTQQMWYPEGYHPHSVYKAHEGGKFFFDLCHKGNSDSLQRITKAVQGMSEGIGADGGFAVIPEFSQNIFTRVYENSLFEMTDNYSVAGNTMTFPRNAEVSRTDGNREGGLLAYWPGEGGSITASKPTVSQFNLKLKKVAVVCYLTDELIQDAGQSLEAYVTRKVGNEFNFQIGNAVFAGQGTARPQGLLYSKATIQVAKENGQATKTIVAANIMNMWRRLYAGSWDKAVWFINQNCLTMAGLLGMTIGVGTGGAVVFMPPGGLSNSPYFTLMGRPVMPLEFCPALGTPGDITLADMSHYCTISKGGVVQAQSIHVEFLTDQLALRFTMRVDGETWENAPVVPYQGDATNDTQSSFVTLATR